MAPGLIGFGVGLFVGLIFALVCVGFGYLLGARDEDITLTPGDLMPKSFKAYGKQDKRPPRVNDDKKAALAERAGN